MYDKKEILKILRWKAENSASIAKTAEKFNVALSTVIKWQNKYPTITSQVSEHVVVQTNNAITIAKKDFFLNQLDTMEGLYETVIQRLAIVLPQESSVNNLVTAGKFIKEIIKESGEVINSENNNKLEEIIAASHKRVSEYMNSIEDVESEDVTDK